MLTINHPKPTPFKQPETTPKCRTFGSTAAIQGQSLLVIGKILGHAVPSTTAIYAHLTDRVVADASEKASNQPT